MSRKVWVGGILRDTTGEDLREKFEAHGGVEEVIMKGNYAFVIMDSDESAAKAIAELNNTLAPETQFSSPTVIFCEFPNITLICWRINKSQFASYFGVLTTLFMSTFKKNSHRKKLIQFFHLA